MIILFLEGGFIMGDFYSTIEKRTANGQLVNLDYYPDRITPEEIEKLLKGIKSMEVPFTKVVGDVLGDFDNCETVRLSRFDVKVLTDGSGKKLKGFFVGEGALEVVDPPDGRNGIIIYLSDSNCFKSGHPISFSFYEFENKEAAIKAWKDIHNHFIQGYYWEKMEKMPGLIRRVPCGIFQPWFYAVADQQIVSDLVVPYEVKEDHAFQFGRKFVVHPESGYWLGDFPQIKTFWGMRVVTEERSFYGNEKSKYRYIFWSDGSISKIDANVTPEWIQPLEGESLLGQMALDAVKEVSAGLKKEAEVVCADGSRVIIKWVPVKESRKKHHKGAIYQVDFLAEKESGERKQYKIEQEFVPHPNQTTAEDFFGGGVGRRFKVNVFEKEASEDEHAVIKKIFKIKMIDGSSRGKKKWAGFFPNPEDRNR